MSRFNVETRIDAPREKVWEVLSDLGSIYKWNPGVSHSYSTSEAGSGEGATRHCDLQSGTKSIGYLEERAFDWRDGEGFKIDIYESNLPIKRNIIEFTLSDTDGGTVVSLTPDYQLKFGVLGWLMDKLIARRQLKKGMKGLLDGLRYHVETGREVGSELPSRAA